MTKLNKKIKNEKLVKEIISDEKQIKLTKNKKAETKKIVTYFFMSLSVITTLSLFLYTVISSTNVVDQLSSIISVLILTIFSILFVYICLYAEMKKGNVFIIFASFVLTIYSGFILLTKTNVLVLPTQPIVENFTYKSLTEVVSWATSNNVLIEQIYESSDIVQPYYIISQDVKAGTLIKNVTKLKVIVSVGPDSNKEVLFPNMIGKNVDDVIKFVEENYFANVNIDFAFSDIEQDLIFEQDKSGSLARNSIINLVASLGSQRELADVYMTDLINSSYFYATTWLKRNVVKYKIEYDYSSTIKKGNVISQSINKGEAVTPNETEVIITISKGNKIIVPDIESMTIEEITKWTVDNKLKLDFNDKYHDEIPLGKLIESNIKKDDILEEGSLVKITVSKGQLKMENFKTATEYREWADKYNIVFREDNEFNENIPKGDIISKSHTVGQTIKENDTVIITTSLGKEIKVPKFIGKTKSSIQAECNKLNLTCTFVYGGMSETVAKDIAIKQSKSEGSSISNGTVITISLSSGILEKITIPNFVGKDKTTIQNQCNSLGISCSFINESSYTSTQAGLATRQDKTGNAYKGAKVKIFISIGPAKTYNVVIQSTWFGSTYQDTVNSLKSKLTASCPGVNFIFEAKDVNQGPGVISDNSPIKAGMNSFIQGRTYKIIINR